MSSAYRELPALPIVAPLAILAFAVLLWHLRRRGALTVPRAIVAALACAYGAGVIANTLFPIYRDMPGSSQAWTDHLNLIPLAGTELADMLQNVLVFLPLGVLLSLLGRVRSAIAALLGGLALSLAMEVLQLANDVTGHGGHIADVNDLLANTLGCLVGYALFRVALLLPPVRRLATAATWPARGEEPAERRRTTMA